LIPFSTVSGGICIIEKQIYLKIKKKKKEKLDLFNYIF